MNKVYILTKLYNINDRIASLNLGDAIDEWIEHNMLDFQKCFLPYRDSNEKVKHMRNQTKNIFILDCNNIKESDILLGFFDGPSFDSGIAFEIGYAFILGKEVIVITTDYYNYHINSMQFAISPLVQTLFNPIHIAKCDKSSTTYREYLSSVYDLCISRAKESITKAYNGRNCITDIFSEIDFFIDFHFSATESSKIILEKIISILKDKDKTFYVCKFNDFLSISRLCGLIKSSKNILIYGDGFDMNVDSAVIQGLAYGMRKHIILYCSDAFRLYQSSSFILRKNPMIEHSADIIIDSYNDLRSKI